MDWEVSGLLLAWIYCAREQLTVHCSYLEFDYSTAGRQEVLCVREKSALFLIRTLLDDRREKSALFLIRTLLDDRREKSALFLIRTLLDDRREKSALFLIRTLLDDRREKSALFLIRTLLDVILVHISLMSLQLPIPSLNPDYNFNVMGRARHLVLIACSM